jgi:hypothetical protein
LTSPEFGPRGYLPQKAAKRARKIILREQMGFGWPLAAVGAAVLVVVAGVLFLRSFNRPPGEPFVALAPVVDIPAGGASVVPADGTQGLVLRVGGTIRTFLVEDDEIVWCAQTQRLEAPGSAWAPDGRRSYGDGPSLQQVPSVVYDGVVYANLDSPLPAPAPGPQGAPPVCVEVG